MLPTRPSSLHPTPAGSFKRLAHFALTMLVGTFVMAACAQADTGTVTSLHTFSKTDGAWLYGGLVRDTAGNFYGTASEGGANDKGVVYKITPAGTVTVLHSFSGPDGVNPQAGLVLGDDGNLYGTTILGGAGSPASGTIFMITLDGTFTSLHSFCVTHVLGVCADGQLPTMLIKGNDGGIYGAVPISSISPGYIFKIKSDGTFTTVCSGSIGDNIVQDSHGNFFGTTHNSSNATTRDGLLFKCTSNGRFSVLYTVSSVSANGKAPVAPLLLASDGNLYGTTTDGGGPDGNGDGTIFKLEPSGTLTTLHVFDSPVVGDPDVVAPLVEASDGNIYGVASGGGASGAGEIFRITPSGTFTVLHSFSGSDDKGINPRGALLETQPGIFYGTTYGGGAGGLVPGQAFGTIYQYSTTGGTVPPIPTSLRAVAGDGSVDLSWAAASGATSYNVYQGAQAGGEAATPVKTGITGTQATITGLTNGTTYYFTVAAVNGSAVSKTSGEASATPLAAPGQVTGLTASPSDGQVQLAWNAVSGATGYTINQGTSAGGETFIASGVTGTSYTVTGLKNGTQYYFTVVATNTAGKSLASAEVSASPGKAATPPANTGSSDSGNSGGGGGATSPIVLGLLLLAAWIRRRHGTVGGTVKPTTL